MEELYLRLSVTDRCNLRCTYCMPSQGVELLRPGELLTFEEIRAVARAIDSVIPLTKIRITGGEPLVRRGITSLVSMLHEGLPAARLCMTTNGIRLSRFSRGLREAGLERVNVSLDTLDPDRYRRVTRGGELARAIRGIRTARTAGLRPVRLNCVVQRGFNDDEVPALTQFALQEGLELRFLELMAIGEARAGASQRCLPSAEVLERISARFEVFHLGEEGTARRYEVRDGPRSIQLGLLSPVSEPFCSRCDRLRLDAKGRLWPCLLSMDRLDLAPLVRGPMRPGEIERTVRAALRHKSIVATSTREDPMSAIGG